MTTIQIRIGMDILKMFSVALVALTVLVMFIGVAREALEQGLGVAGVLQLIPYAAPNALAVAVPGTALFSVCCVYGRMSADNEFTAMQSVGISPIPAMLPAIVITTVLSLATVGLINTAFTWGFHGIQKVVMSSVERVAYGVLQRDRSFQHGSMSLNVRDVQGKTLVDPVINLRRANNESVSINARSATLSYDDDAEALTLSVTDGSASVGGKASFHFPDTLVHTIPLSNRPAYDVLTANPSHMPMSDFASATVKQKLDIHQRESEVAVRVGFSVLGSRCDTICDSAAQARLDAVARSHKRLRRIDTEVHRRWSSGFTCLAMALLGIPLAIRMKTADTMTTFGIVFLPTLLVYYPIFALCLDMAKEGKILSIGVWIANGLSVAIGVLLIRRTVYFPA
ncbi:LptF/LptG family permease [Rubripirellula reticaptiva]|uniref:Putative permease YjgP/YjgQ family protein n=1 Tax=Rubripirellula reticaptiva TaxID=2528013 RepID=A0A5C6EHG0_9BACT|nr:LptF/LptG family permease [Rubripirellula reticaptiva]TWU47885.1 putative permease YjgP/YjgQ family protein [Rubripirellula reticaptiva]